MSAAQTADIRAAMQGLRTTSVQMQPSTLPPVVPHLGLGESSTLIPARSFVPRRLCLTPLPCVVGPPIMPSSSPTGRLRRMYERGAQEAALRSDLCRVQHSLNDDILKDKETEDLHWVQQRGRAQIAKFQQRDSQRRSSQWQELSPGGLSGSIVLKQSVDKIASHSLPPSVEVELPQCNPYEVPEYAAMMTVRRHAWHRPMHKRMPPPAAENSPGVAADEGTRGSSGLWAILMACVAYLVCVAGAVYRAGRLPFAVRSSRQQRTANWKSRHLEHQVAGGNGQKQVHAEEEYSAGQVSSLHSVSKPAQQESKISLAQHTGYMRRRQGQHHPLSMMTAAIATIISV